jgi:hypothetical protein
MPLDLGGSWQPSAEVPVEGAQEAEVATVPVRSRPWEITAIALLQFVEAAAFLALALSLAVYPSRDMFTLLNMSFLIDYLIRDGAPLSPVLIPLLLFLAAFTGVLGVGLWVLEENARKVLLGTSSVIVGILFRMFKQLYTRGIEIDPAVRLALYIVVLVNVFTFGYLYIHEKEFTPERKL